MNMNNKNEQLLQRYLDGELSAEEEKEALHLFADDPEMRDLLRLDRQLIQTVNTEKGMEPSSFSVPEGFTDSVMQQIAQQKETRENPNRLFQWIQMIWKPQVVELRPATVFAVIALMGFFFLMPSEEPNREAPQQAGVQLASDTAEEEEVWVRFVYMEEDADSVSIAGDFNDWEHTPLSKQEIDGEEVWTALVSLPRGEHRYMFVLNGERWVTDPLADIQREDGFGNKNAVIYL